MLTLKEAVNDFLTQKRIAIAGVSSTRNINANIIYRKFRDSGYQVFAVNPNAETVEGDPCYHDLNAIEGGVDGVVIVTRPQETEKIVFQCIQARVPRVWIHRSFEFIGNSVSESAVRTCRENGIAVIPGACPMMYLKPVDWRHLCLREVVRLFRRLPRPIPIERAQ